MSASLDQSRSQQLHAAAELADRAGGESTERFLRRYYRHVATEDLLARDPEDLLGAALSHQQLAANRPVGTANVRVFTPTVEENGWSCGHTVVEIVTDDMPFLVDSVTAELSRQERAIHLVVHPQLVVRRDATGVLLEILDVDADGHGPSSASTSSRGCTSRSTARAPTRRLRPSRPRLLRVLSDVREAVEDWPKMTPRAPGIAAELAAEPPAGVSAEEVAEAHELLDWLADDHFTFLGYREYDLAARGRRRRAARRCPAPASGILRSDQPRSGVVRPAARRGARQGPRARSCWSSPRPTPAPPCTARLPRLHRRQDVRRDRQRHRRAALPRPVHLRGLHRVACCGSRSSRRRSPRSWSGPASRPTATPARTCWRSSRPTRATSCSRPPATSCTTSPPSVLHLQERRQTRLFLRQDDYGRFMSCLVYLPRDRYTTAVRLRDGGHPARGVRRRQRRLHHAGLRVGAGPAALRGPGRGRASRSPTSTRPSCERRLVDATRTWDEDFAEARPRRVRRGGRRAPGRALRQGLPRGLQGGLRPRVAVADLRHLEALEQPRTRSG